MDEPFLVALKIVGGGEDFRVVEESHVNIFAIGDGSAGGVTVELVLVLERRGEDGFLPEDVAGLAVEAEEHAVLGVGEGGDGEDLVLPNNGRGVAEAGEFGFPKDVAGGAPVEGKVGFQAGAVAP